MEPASRIEKKKLESVLKCDWENRTPVERRSDSDSRSGDSRTYLNRGGIERRKLRERRKPDERRDGWLRIDKWRSIAVFDD